MMRCYVRTAGGEMLADVTPAQLPALLPDPRNVVWADLDAPSAGELALLGHIFGINDLTIEDVAKQGQRAKVESYDHYIYFVMHAIRHDPRADRTTTPELDLILGENYLVSVHYGLLGEIVGHHFAAVVGDVMARGADFLLYTLADNLVDSYFPALDSIDDEIDSLEDDVVSLPRDNVLPRIFHLKRDLIQLRKVVSPQLQVFANLTNRSYAQIKEEHLIYFRDVHDHLIRAFEIIDSYRDLMSGALDAYLSTVNNRLNEVMKRLTVIATIFMPITFITGLFGQNFRVMPQVQWDTGYSFWIVLAAIAVISAVQVWYYWRKGWL